MTNLGQKYTSKMKLDTLDLYAWLGHMYQKYYFISSPDLNSETGQNLGGRQIFFWKKWCSVIFFSNTRFFRHVYARQIQYLKNL